MQFDMTLLHFFTLQIYCKKNKAQFSHVSLQLKMYVYSNYTFKKIKESKIAPFTKDWLFLSICIQPNSKNVGMLHKI